MICSVGYALNPKKLRKSGLDEAPHPELSSHLSSHQISPRSPPSSYPSSTLGSSSCSSSSCPPPPTTNHNPLTNIWRGGGLADIISGGLECEGVKFIPWNYEVPVALQPEFDVIIHKLTEDIDRKESIEKITALKQYLHHHPNTVIVDSLEAVRKVISRARCCESLANVIKKLGPSCPFSQPGFFVVESEEESSAKNILRMMGEKGIGFPVMCKPVEACGTPNSHRMVVVLSSVGFESMAPPFIVQEYKDHNEFFFKVYVMGDEVMVFRRPSLPDLDELAVAAGNRRNYHTKSSVNNCVNNPCMNHVDNSSHTTHTTHCVNNGNSVNSVNNGNNGNVESKNRVRNCNCGTSSANCSECGGCGHLDLDSSLYVGMKSVAFDSRYAYPTALDFMDNSGNNGNNGHNCNNGNSNSNNSGSNSKNNNDHKDSNNCNNHDNSMEEIVGDNLIVKFKNCMSGSNHSNDDCSNKCGNNVSSCSNNKNNCNNGNNNGSNNSSHNNGVSCNNDGEGGKSSEIRSDRDSVLPVEGRAKKPSAKDMPSYESSSPTFYSLSLRSSSFISSSLQALQPRSHPSPYTLPSLHTPPLLPPLSSLPPPLHPPSSSSLMPSVSLVSSIQPCNPCSTHLSHIDHIQHKESLSHIENIDHTDNRHLDSVHPITNPAHSTPMKDNSTNNINNNGNNSAVKSSGGSSSKMNVLSIDEDRFRAAAMSIKEEFGLSLFGFDLIVPVRRIDRRVEERIEDSSNNSNNHNSAVKSSGGSNSKGWEEESFTEEERVTWTESKGNWTDSKGTESEGTESRGNCCGSSSEDCKCYNRNIDANNANSSSDNSIIQTPDTHNTNRTHTSKYEEDELELVVIDVNYFPSYKEVPDFPQKLRRFLREKANMTPIVATAPL